MIAVFKKCTIYEDDDPHKNIMFQSFYRIAFMITILFTNTAIIITIFTKNVLNLSLYVAMLTKYLVF